jgi:ABC-2 type transport system permease protein
LRNSFTIFRKEIASFFNSLVGYMVLIVFMVLTGLFFWVFGEHVLVAGKANMDLLFQFAPIFFILLIPAITMRSISEEMRTGTIETLATKPLTNLQLVLGKFSAAAFLVFLTLLPTLVFYLTLQDLARDPAELRMEANPEFLNQSLGAITYTRKLDNGPIIGGYIGLLALGAIFAALGILSSALSDNQVVAYLVGAFLCFMMYFGFSFSSELEGLTRINLSIDRLGIMAHYENIAKGVVDTRDIVYFFSILVIALAITNAILSLKRR